MRKTLLLALSVLLVSTLAFAGDPPARVARLSYLSGQVSIQPDGVNDWVQASINRPLTSSDRVWADTDGRAELQLGGASLRLDNSTSLTLVNVSDNNVQLQLDQGTASVHVTDLFDGQIYEVDTPNVAFIVRKRGDYRFDVDNAGDTTDVTVFHGEGDATGEGPAIRVKSEQRYTFTGGKTLRYTVNNNPGVDGFDQWAFARAEREDKAVSARYVSRYAVGYSDLDDNGYWETAPTYGAIWYPRGVAVGWAPYRYGHWVWVGPWGWTWVDDAPWGFAPFHYGRWVYYRSRWGWCPGPYNVRPIYAPALVGWVGGANWGVGISFGIGGGVGWFPLGWNEPYFPYYSHSRGYFQHVNVWNTHIRNINYITNNYYGHHDRHWNYAYGRHSYAVTAVPNDTFRLSRPTRDGYVRVDDRHLRQVSFERNVPLRPTTNSVLGPHAGDRRATPPTRWERPQRTERVAAGNAGSPRSDRGTPRETVGREAGVNSPRVSGRQNGRYPHPERGNGTTMADNERPRGIPGRANSEPQSNTTAMPSRVPRPPDSLNHENQYARHGGGDRTSPANGERPNAVEAPNREFTPNRGSRTATRPPAEQPSRPERNDPPGRIDRQPAPRVNEERNVPRPESRPMPATENRNQGVSHAMRPQPSPAREARPHTAEPQRGAPSNHGKPEHNPKVEPKTERENSGRQQGAVNYPRPNGAVRAASFSSSERYSPRNYNTMSDNYGATSQASHSSSFSRPSYSAPARVNSYSQPARSYSAYSRQSRAYSQPSRSYSASARSHSSYSRGSSYSTPSHSSHSSGGSSHSSSHSSGGSRGGGGSSSHKR